MNFVEEISIRVARGPSEVSNPLWWVVPLLLGRPTKLKPITVADLQRAAETHRWSA